MPNPKRLLFLFMIALCLLSVTCADKEADQATIPETAIVANDEGDVEAAAAIFSVKPLDFGNVPINTVSPTTRWLIKNNTTTRTLIITGFRGDTTTGRTPKKKSNGTCGVLPWELGPKESCYVNMVFRPTREGEITRDFEYSVNFGTGIRVRAARGTGIRIVDPGTPGISVSTTQLNLAAGGSSGQVTITNTGDANLTVDYGLNFTDEGCIDFEKTNNCVGTIPGGQDCTVDVLCTDQCGGMTDTGTLNIQSNAGNKTVNLFCQG